MKNDLSPSSSCFRKTDMSILSLLLFHGPSAGRVLDSMHWELLSSPCHPLTRGLHCAAPGATGPNFAF